MGMVPELEELLLDEELVEELLELELDELLLDDELVEEVLELLEELVLFCPPHAASAPHSRKINGFAFMVKILGFSGGYSLLLVFVPMDGGLCLCVLLLGSRKLFYLLTVTHGPYVRHF